MYLLPDTKKEELERMVNYTEVIRDNLINVISALAVAEPTLSLQERTRLSQLKNNLAAIRKALFIPYADQDRTLEIVKRYFKTLFLAKTALNGWRLWYDFISKEDTEKGKIYAQGLQALGEIEALPGLDGGRFEKVDLSSEKAELNQQVGDEIKHHLTREWSDKHKKADLLIYSEKTRNIVAAVYFEPCSRDEAEKMSFWKQLASEM